jgi:hypothetical protein
MKKKQTFETAGTLSRLTYQFNANLKRCNEKKNINKIF